jgi:anhydro-N-acetylmuramic acid kinase
MNRVDLLHKISSKPEKTVIGLMSGMSMDGVNLACIKISGEFPDFTIQVVGTHIRPYPAQIRKELLQGKSANVADVAELNFLIAYEFSDCVCEFLDKAKLKSDQIDLIGSHGQTLYHSSSNDRARTIQIGDPSIIAEKTGIITVGNFRIRDLEAGGLGAPLVSLADYILYHKSNEVVAVNNLGSISNVTVVTPKLEDVLAFDTGPANMAIDFFAQRVPGNIAGIDTDGAISASGKAVDPLLRELLALPFFQKAPPKAAGYAEFGPPVLVSLLSRYAHVPIENLVRTGVEFAAVTIRDAYHSFVLPKFPKLREVRFSGGGIHNKTLMGRIKDLLPQLAIQTFDPEFADAKEAVAFGILAHETACGRAGNVLGATGAKKRVILGEIAL